MDWDKALKDMDSAIFHAQTAKWQQSNAERAIDMKFTRKYLTDALAAIDEWIDDHDGTEGQKV